MTNKNFIDIISVQMNYSELKALMEVLDFANRAASILAQQEMVKGSGITGAAKMNRLAQDAKELHYIIAKNTIIGEPDGVTH